MRWTGFVVIQLIIIALIFALVSLHDDKVAMLKTPPKALAKWYKPENKRQVWLHNMFQLRREIQAVNYYAQNQDSEHVEKWLSKLNSHYLKISDMVPQWQRKLAPQILVDLQQQLKDENYRGVINLTKQLQQNCDSCHQDYQAITALTYRTPDFSAIELTSQLTFKEQMHRLSEQVNQIKISSEDGVTKMALQSLDKLEKGMTSLGETCVACHKSGRSYPSVEMHKTISRLKHNLVNGRLKEQGRDLGTLAVLACAQCHGTHKLAFSMKTKLNQQQSWLKSIKHN